MINKFGKLIIIFITLLYAFELNANISIPDQNLYVNSPELSKLEKVKNIKNKKAKVNKYGHIYIGQKGLVLNNGYGILKFEDGGIFVGYFHKGNMRDGSWIIDGKVNYETFEYSEKNKPKKDSNGVVIVNKTDFRPAKEFEIQYILENVFLKKKITYKEYLKLTGKDKLLAKKKEKKSEKTVKTNNNEDDQYYKYSKTGFNIFSGNLNDDKNQPYLVRAYYEDDCIQHGTVVYMYKEQKPKQEIIGIFANCQVSDPDSKYSNVFFDENGKISEITLYKKDVSHIYGVRRLIGVEVEDTPNKTGVRIRSFQKNLPAINSSLEKNDLLLRVNGVDIKSTYQFIQLIKESEINKKINFDYIASKNINDNLSFDKSKIKTISLTPKQIKSKIELRLTYIPKDDVYHEYIFDHTTQRSTDILDLIQLKKDSDEWISRQSILKNEFNELYDYFRSIRKVRNNKLPLFDYSQLYIVSNKKTNNIAKDNQEEFKPDGLDDKDPPIIKVAKNFKFESSSYSIKGEVKDNKSDLIYIEVDGILSEAKNGTFEIDRFSPVDEQIKLVAIDKWGNRSEPTIISVKIEKKKIIAKQLDKLNPLVNKVQIAEDKVALIIGIENYQKTPKASFANLDAEFFYEYSKNVFGVKDENIKLLVNDQASLIDTLGALNKWLPGKIKKNKTELLIYFAGHGLASSDGKELYILPQDGDSDLLARTGISRTELHETITKYSPKNVTIFLDTCYSGVSRDEQTLLASARPVRIIANDQSAPKNFTIFSASQLDQISSGLKEVKHGIFSYFLMKGLEGKADLNNDNKITNGELLVYLDENVSQKAAELGRQQNPSLAGDPERVLVSY